MRVFGIVGRSGSGKTTLIEKLLPALISRGLSVSTMKHSHHSFDMDQPGKDSWRHREAGAAEVMVVSGERWSLLSEQRDGSEPDVDALVARMRPVDLLLIEGFRAHSHPKIEVHRPATGKAVLWQPGSDIVAVASDVTLPDVTAPILDLDDVETIAEFITSWGVPRRRPARRPQETMWALP